MVFQWKIKFNTGLTKQAQKIIFNRKKTVSIQPVVYIPNTPVNSVATDKHFEMILDSKSSYKNHLQSVFSIVNKPFWEKFNLRVISAIISKSVNQLLGLN